jgi:hypothetical protein
MLETVILYVGVAALLLVLAMVLDQHKVLKFLALIFCVYVILISGSAAINSATVCDLKLNYTATVTDNQNYIYSEYCYTNSANLETAKTFYKTVLWFFSLVFVYMFVFMVYTVLTYLGLVGKRGV